MDAVNNEFVVVQVSNPTITVYGWMASGNLGPLRTIVGAATGLNGPVGISVENVNNELA